MQFEPFLGSSEESECGMVYVGLSIYVHFLVESSKCFFVMVELWLEFIQDNVKFVLCTSAALN